MNRLIYHSPEKTKMISPFDNTLTEIVKDKVIKIACPYIGFYYIQKLIKLCKDWKLLTDVNAWIYSQTSKEQQKMIYNFLIQYQDKIHHYPELHAKVIITDSKLFLGSSNFTDNGVFRKNEMSILIAEENNIQEANQWFDDWWRVSSFPSQNELKEICDSGKYIRTEGNLIKVKSTAPKIKTTEVPFYLEVEKNKYSELPISEISLINYLRKWGNRSWEWDFFEMIKKGIITSGLSKDDVYLTLTLTQAGGITVQINNRYILKSHSYEKPEMLGLMLPLEFRKYEHDYQEEVYEIESFTQSKSEAALWVLFKKEKIVFEDTVVDLWEKAIRTEVSRKYLSPFRRFHQELIFDIAMDIEKRNELFKAFED